MAYSADGLAGWMALAEGNTNPDSRGCKVYNLSLYYHSMVGKRRRWASSCVYTPGCRILRPPSRLSVFLKHMIACGTYTHGGMDRLVVCIGLMPHGSRQNTLSGGGVSTS